MFSSVPALLFPSPAVFAMAALSPHLTTALPFPPTLRPPPRRLPPAAAGVPPRGSRIVLRGFSGITLAVLHRGRPDPLARNFLWFENATSLQVEHQKQALFASETDSPNTGKQSSAGKQSSSSDDNSSSSDGPPVLTIVAGVVVFLLVFWVIGSIITWIVGLVLGAAKS